VLESGELQSEDKLLFEALARDIVTAERLAQAEPAVVVPAAGVPFAKPRARGEPKFVLFARGPFHSPWRVQFARLIIEA
jgi:hypothetical protein